MIILGGTMREIKFRAFIDGKMIPVSIINNYRFCAKAEELDFETMIGTVKLLEECPVMQFTGLHDKNGKEVFEGDILRTHRFIQVLGANLGVSEGEEINICVVQYRNEDACFVFVPIKENKELNYLNPWDLSDEGIEVIGNIYENKDLLK